MAPALIPMFLGLVRTPPGVRNLKAIEESKAKTAEAAALLDRQLGKTALMTGAQLALQHIDESQKQPKAKCPFTPQREMISKLWGADARSKATQQTLFN